MISLLYGDLNLLISLLYSDSTVQLLQYPYYTVIQIIQIPTIQNELLYDDVNPTR